MQKFMFTKDTPFVGTAKQFADSNVFLNDQRLDQVSVGALARHGLIEDAGDGPKPLRGRTPRMYRVFSQGNMVFTRQDCAPVTKTAENTQAEQSDNSTSVDESTQA